MLLCGEIHSKPISDEAYGPIFSVAEVPLNGIAPFARCCTLFFSERSVPFPGAQFCFTCTCKAAWDAHVVLSHMHMSYCFTCTSKTALHTEASYVTLRDRALSIPEKEIDGNGRQHLAQNWIALVQMIRLEKNDDNHGKLSSFVTFYCIRISSPF